MVRCDFHGIQLPLPGLLRGVARAKDSLSVLAHHGPLRLQRDRT